MAKLRITLAKRTTNEDLVGFTEWVGDQILTLTRMEWCDEAHVDGSCDLAEDEIECPHERLERVREAIEHLRHEWDEMPVWGEE